MYTFVTIVQTDMYRYSQNKYPLLNKPCLQKIRLLCKKDNDVMFMFTGRFMWSKYIRLFSSIKSHINFLNSISHWIQLETTWYCTLLTLSYPYDLKHVHMIFIFGSSLCRTLKIALCRTMEDAELGYEVNAYVFILTPQ